MKIYDDQNVYEATMDRYDVIFNNFDHIYLSVSGGKDSSVMLQLAAKKARELNKKFDVLYIDLEAQYQATIQHVEELKEITSDVVNRWYWFCIPLVSRDSVSIIQTEYVCWNRLEMHKWVREMPNNADVIDENNIQIPGFQWGMEFEEFVVLFANWYREQHGEKCAVGVGIRSDESLNRFRTIVSDKKSTFEEHGWTTQIKYRNKYIDVYCFYPLYDWRAEDIWTAVAKFELRFNNIYELMYKNGLSIYEQRICEPFGDDQRRGLSQYKALESETWEKLLNRVQGINYGNIYCKTNLIGHQETAKPPEMSWEEYTVFLLESIGFHNSELRDHYHRKISKWCSELEEHPERTKIENMFWRKVARAIEKNDVLMSEISISQTRRSVEKMENRKEKYMKLIHGRM